MATKIDSLPNCFLINAPAGSGKTTTIEKMILDLMGEKKAPSVLCITYTNRGADELLGRLEFSEVDISTIHSFINEFISIYFNHPEVITLYFELFEEDIANRIKNLDEKSNIMESNNKYVEKYGELSIDAIKRNLKALTYNELSFSSLYYGALSHDDLLYFAHKVMARFPKIEKRLAQKYDYIFIDEYQDTSADVLRLFYNAVKKTDTQLYLLGDKMQQIYKNYDGSFEEELKLFNQEKKLNTNYRSSKPVVDALNCIYNDKAFKQLPYQKNKSIEIPTVYIVENQEKFMKEFSDNHSDTLQLVIYNKQRFRQIGAKNLFEAFKKVKAYSFGRKHNPTDVLTAEESPDDLIKLLNRWHQISIWYQQGQYGSIIQMLKQKMKLDHKFVLNWHRDKIVLNQKFFRLLSYYKEREGDSIKDWLLKIDKEELINKDFLDMYISNEEYDDVLSVPLKEFKNIAAYNYEKYPKVSTQHGVKGEGHDEVIFIANNSTNPNVRMYNFLSIWANNDVDFTGMQEFYYKFKQAVDVVQAEIPFSLKKITAKEKDIYVDLILKHMNAINNEFKTNIYFNEVYSDYYKNVLKKKKLTVKNVQSAFNIGKMEGVLNAYKLFYVGCSRAKKVLTVLIDETEVIGKRAKLEQKFRECGFVVK